MFEPSVVGLNRVVDVPLDVVPRRRDQFVEHDWVDRGGDGDHLGRDHLQRLKVTQLDTAALWELARPREDRSMSTTSGWVRWVAATASTPLSASATTAQPGWADSSASTYG
jgi:hypothetical protein